MNASGGNEGKRMRWIWLRSLTVVLAMFVAGAAFEKYKFYPYYQLEALLKSIKPAKPGDPVATLARQYSRDDKQLELGRAIDTGLLPLKISGVRISDYVAIAKGAGGITIVGDGVIIADRLGNFFEVEAAGQKIAKLDFPPLPNHVQEYLKQPGTQIDSKRFRAYDVEYIPSARLLAVSHETFDPQSGKCRLAVSILPIDEKALRPVGPWETVFVGSVEPGGPNESGGGRLAIGADDKLYLTVGDYAITDPRVSQDPNSSFGKIVEIDLKSKNHKFLSSGHRNPQGFVVTKAGLLISTEHGPKGGDELNVITPGANYGWPIVSLGTDYASYGLGEQKAVGEHSGFVEPLFAWVPSIAPSNVIEIKSFDKRWNGDLLVGSLKAMSLFRLRLAEGRVLYAEPIWIGQRIRDLTQLGDGTIVLWTDDSHLLFLSVDGEALSQNGRPAVLASLDLNNACMYCHHLGPTSPSDFAPSLTGLFGRKIASDNYRYSAGLRAKQGSWSEETLREFLRNPTEFAEGTLMPNLGLSPELVDEVVKALKDIDLAADGAGRSAQQSDRNSTSR